MDSYIIVTQGQAKSSLLTGQRRTENVLGQAKSSLLTGLISAGIIKK